MCVCVVGKDFQVPFESEEPGNEPSTWLVTVCTNNSLNWPIVLNVTKEGKDCMESD